MSAKHKNKKVSSSPYIAAEPTNRKPLTEKKEPYTIRNLILPAISCAAYFCLVNFAAGYFPLTPQYIGICSFLSLTVSLLSYAVYRFMNRNGERIHALWGIMIAGNLAASFDQLNTLVNTLLP